MLIEIQLLMKKKPSSCFCSCSVNAAPGISWIVTLIPISPSDCCTQTAVSFASWMPLMICKRRLEPIRETGLGQQLLRFLRIVAVR